MSKPVVLVDPHPRLRERIFDAAQWRRLTEMAEPIEDTAAPMPDGIVDRWLPEAVAIVGQTALPRARIERAERLRAVINVEGNFL